MFVDSAYSDELFKRQATVDRLDAERKAMLHQPQFSFEERYAKTKEYTEAYNALNDFVLPRINVRD
ncbi:hypothetical protein HQ399_04925 [Aeromonas jandaei]|uniref:Uncharacterized protein n=1 Tax=Aeromonas jandaei TaxID=650 RepID=A0ABD7EKP6_AERJA|nr:hypothetical protein [Aeromonas jandaei]QWL61627.1 hypothetical protein HQ399_04925 [Aeromonas jandaei]